MKTKLKIEGMSCAHCVSSVTKALQGVKRVQDATVSLELNQAIVIHDDADLNELIRAVEEEGYQAEVA